MPDSRKAPTDRMGPPPRRVQEWINEAASLTGLVPRQIQTILYAESKYHPFPADGSSGEIGPMQLMPGTRKKFNLTDRQARDPRTNIIVGAKQLRDLMDTYGGDFLRAATAYNGSGPAARAYGLNAMRLYSQQPGATSQTSQPSSPSEVSQIRGPRYGGRLIPAAERGKPSPGTALPLTPEQRDRQNLRELTLRAEGKWPGQQSETGTVNRAEPRPAGQRGGGGPTAPPPGSPTNPARPTPAGTDQRVWLIDPQGRAASYPAGKVYSFLKRHPDWKADPSYVPKAQRGKPGGASSDWIPSPLSRFWDWMQRGLVSPNTMLQKVVAPDPRAPGAAGYAPLRGKTVGQLETMANRPMQLSDVPPTVRGPGGQTIAPEAYNPAWEALKARLGSSMTSPLSIATLGAGGIAEGTSILAPYARAALTGTGLVQGAQGAGDVYGGFQKGWSTPEGRQQLLGGLASMLGAIPAVHQVGRSMVMPGVERVFPTLKLYDEEAMVAALAPGQKDVQTLRNAFQRVKNQIMGAPVKSIPEMRDFAARNKTAAINARNAELIAVNPRAGHINPVTWEQDARRRFLNAVQRSQRTPGIRGAAAYPRDIRIELAKMSNTRANMVSSPVDIVQANDRAEIMNTRLFKYYSSAPDAQRLVMAGGDLEAAAEKAMKDAYQAQIERKMNLAGSHYREANLDFGAWKDIENLSTNRIDELARKAANESYAQRRMAEHLGTIGATAAAIPTAGILAGTGHPIAAGAAALVPVGSLAGETINRLAHDPNFMLRRAVSMPPGNIQFTGAARTQPIVRGLIPRLEPDQGVP